MLKWIRSLFSKQPDASPENEVRALKLELAERDRQIIQLKSDLERHRQQADMRGAESVQAQLVQLFVEVATPVSQLQTQAHLLEAENKPVQARDILTVARRLVRTLEDNGLLLENRVGEQVPFDPDLHELLAGTAPQQGRPVIVRFPGVAYRGKLLRKAGVEPMGGQ